MNRILMLILFLFFGHYTFGQEESSALSPEGLKKNNIQINLGYFMFRGAGNLTYERQILKFKQEMGGSISARLGYGFWGVWSTGGPYQSIALVFLSGAKNGHFEINFGGARMVDRQSFEHAQDMEDSTGGPEPVKSSFTDIRAVGAIGYRYQKPGGSFLFRSGIAYPEAVYLGLGIAF